MNPTKFSISQDEVPSTKPFNFSKTEPGQPGVFEVNPIVEFDNDPSCRRFSYWNGKAFGPIASSPERAFEQRFGKPVLGGTITGFRGLTEQA